MHTLPALPDLVRPLMDHENARLESRWSLPRDPEHCPTCRGAKSFLWWDRAGHDDAAVVEYECPCVDQYMLQRFLLNSGVNTLWGRARWSDTTGVSPEAQAFVTAYAKDLDYLVRRGTGLFLHGPHGNGKTLLSALIAKRALKSGLDTYFVIFQDMLDLYTGGWRSDAEKSWFEATVRNAELLVIDDMGKEYEGRSGMVKAAVDSIFRARVQSQLATIVTTNETSDQFQLKYGKAVAELATESCRGFEFTGESYRDAEGPLARRNEQEEVLRLTRPFTFG